MRLTLFLKERLICTQKYRQIFSKSLCVSCTSRWVLPFVHFMFISFTKHIFFLNNIFILKGNIKNNTCSNYVKITFLKLYYPLNLISVLYDKNSQNKFGSIKEKKKVMCSESLHLVYLAKISEKYLFFFPT